MFQSWYLKNRVNVFDVSNVPNNSFSIEYVQHIFLLFTFPATERVNKCPPAPFSYLFCFFNISFLYFSFSCIENIGGPPGPARKYGKAAPPGLEGERTCKKEF